MSPSTVMLDDTSSDFVSPFATTKPDPAAAAPRTLLLAPASIASHEEKLRQVLTVHDRSVTDLQMLDRISAGLVSLPDATYDLILVLTDADGTRSESVRLLDRAVFAKIVPALKAGGALEAQDGSLRAGSEGPDAREAVLAGLLPTPRGFAKLEEEEAAVPLKLGFGKNKKKSAAGPAVPGSVAVQPTANVDAKLDAAPPVVRPAGVGFVDFSDDFGTPDDDDELIDEDTLLTEEDLNRPLAIPAECVPNVGKRRKACPDCTCGLAQKLQAEDEAKRKDADAKFKTLKLGDDDLNEVDFTIQGKVGSCGGCALGDAFRCDGCPYLGMPAFKPGEEVSIRNEVQL